ncbi:MAG: hypothetical protein RMK29_17560 [Myxococcales bacterium]|nr:hypothetical protein [Myxococcota bacterium]MDW8283518.1 hypothetical protein [Myxococcales bacterium]
MKASYVTLGLLLLCVGCPPMAPPMEDQVDMAMPPPPDMRRGCDDNAGTKPVGAACTRATRCDCSGPKPDCISSLELGETLDLPGGYCTNTRCSLTDSAGTCGDSGVCVQLSPDGDPLCLQRCRKGQCRADYACVNVAVDPNNPQSRLASVCLPTEGIVECNPTADPTTQCTTIAGLQVSTLTNGAPNAACLRIGPDDAGQCRFLPCQIGPRNCPPLGGTPQGCFYFDVQRNTQNPNPNDKFKGTVCLPIPGMQKMDGEACTGGFNTCGDNMQCWQGVCRQICYNGMQPMYMGGNPMYKNAPLPCPAGRTCRDAFMLGGANWPGLCLP